MSREYILYSLLLLLIAIIMKITVKLLEKLGEIVDYGLIQRLNSTWTLNIVKVQAIKDTKLLKKNKTYIGLKQISYRGWYFDKEIEVISIKNPIFGRRDYSPKNFKVISEIVLTKKELLKILK